MSTIKANENALVTEEMVESWCNSLDDDQWPSGWVNVGDVVSGQPPIATTCSEPITTKLTSEVPTQYSALFPKSEKELFEMLDKSATTPTSECISMEQGITNLKERME